MSRARRLSEPAQGELQSFVEAPVFSFSGGAHQSIYMITDSKTKGYLRLELGDDALPVVLRNV